MIYFDEETHTYTNDSGEIIPGVTTMLKKVGYIDTQFFTQNCRDRGSNVHKVCELIDLGKLQDFPEEVVPYINAYEQFLSENDCKWSYVEDLVYSEALGYAGTLDRAGLVNGQPSILDIKSGSKALWHRIQTVAYMVAAGSYIADGQKFNAIKRYTLYLRKNGSYKLDEHSSPSDLAFWHAAVMTYKGINHG